MVLSSIYLFGVLSVIFGIAYLIIEEEKWRQKRKNNQ